MKAASTSAATQAPMEMREVVRKPVADGMDRPAYSEPTDGARRFRATEAGAEAPHADRSASRAGLARVVEQWTGDDLAHLTALMERFNRSIEALEGGQWPRPTDSTRDS